MSDGDDRYAKAKTSKKQGDACFKGDQFQDAIKNYTEAITVGKGVLASKDMAKCYANRGACWLKMREYTEVIEDCSAAISIDASYMSALLRRATALEATGEVSKARIDVDSILRQEPENSRGLKLLAKLEAQRSESKVDSTVVLGAAEPSVDLSAPEVVLPSTRKKEGFDESRLLSEGEWEAWEKLMKDDETEGEGSAEAAIEALIEQQLQETRAEILAGGTSCGDTSASAFARDPSA
eukprot:SAG31_NODE_402_length_16197_cov_5.262425_13_plen_238_part_00